MTLIAEARRRPRYRSARGARQLRARELDPELPHVPPNVVWYTRLNVRARCTGWTPTRPATMVSGSGSAKCRSTSDRARCSHAGAGRAAARRDATPPPARRA